MKLKFYLIIYLISHISTISSQDTNLNEPQEFETIEINTFSKALLNFKGEDEELEKKFVHKTIIKLKDEKILELIYTSEKNKVKYNDHGKLFFYKNNEKYLLRRGLLEKILSDLTSHLKQIINNEKELHNSIKNIGLLRNEFNQKNKKNLVFRISLMGFKVWVGEDYSVYTPSLYPEDLETWIYSKNNEVFLEITPVYIERDENKITYEQFINSYKPIDIIKLDKSEIMEILKQFEELLSILEKNSYKHNKKLSKIRF